VEPLLQEDVAVQPRHLSIVVSSSLQEVRLESSRDSWVAHRQKDYPWLLLLLMLFLNYLTAGLLTLCFTQVWNFEFRASDPRKNFVGSWTGTASTAITKDNRDYLGPLGNNSITARVSDLPIHDSIVIELEVYILGSWDGVVDDDRLTIILDSKDTLLSSTFSNTYSAQNYPDSRGGRRYPRRTGATEVDCTGWVFTEARVFDGPLDAAYTFLFKAAHSLDTCSISLIGNLKDVRPIPENEAWGVSALRVLAVRTPQPPSISDPQIVPGR